MKMFLKILLAAYFLLQSTMANGEEDYSHDGEENHAEHEQGDEENHAEHGDDENDYEKTEDKEGHEQDEDHNDYTEDDEETDEDDDNAIYADDIVDFESLSTDKKEVQEDIVNDHNNLRRLVKPPAANMLQMVWDDKLMKSAKDWAEKCHLNHSEPKDRNDDGIPYGENILISPASVKWKLCSQQWYNEHKNLNYGVGPINGGVIGHYTQMVTARTSKVGCAVAKCNINGVNKCNYVCQYYPAGNRASSQFNPYDEGKWCSQCEKACDESGKLCMNPCPDPDEAKNCMDVNESQRCGQYAGLCKASCQCKNKIT